jgi:SAM-dependent methyltransferase
VPGDRRKESFDAAAPDYDRYRSPYPDEVVDEVLHGLRIHPGSRVLEIGCGTGQLSVALASQGTTLVAVELGVNLAGFARTRLDPYLSAQVEVSAFEDWPLPEERFDVVVSASAFHWVDPNIRYSKAAQALRPGGVLTIVHAHHVRGGTPGFFEDTQPYYMKWGLSDDPFFQPPRAPDAPVMYPELEEQPEFDSVRRRRFEVPRQHTTESYVGWLKTDSLILSLDNEARRGFLSDIAALIDRKYHGAVSRNFVYEVITAQTRAEPFSPSNP